MRESVKRAIHSWPLARDQIIIVDTGSKDGTQETVLNLGCNLVHHKWDDSFSAARNACLDIATADYLFFLDSDEVILNPHPRMFDFISQKREDGYMITRFEGSKESGGFSHILRIGRKRSDVRFEGRIHEKLSSAIGRVGQSGIEIVHYGYGEVALSKLRLYEKLLMLDLEEDPNAIYKRIELVLTKKQLGADMTEALVSCLRALERDCSLKTLPANGSLVLEQILADKYLYSSHDVRLAFDLFSSFYRDSPPLLGLWQHQLLTEGKVSESIMIGEELLARLNSGKFDTRLPFNKELVLGNCLLNLGVAFWESGHEEESRRFTRSALEFSTTKRLAEENLVMMSNSKSSKESC